MRGSLLFRQKWQILLTCNVYELLQEMRMHLALNRILAIFNQYYPNPFKLMEAIYKIKDNCKLHIGCGNIKLEGFVNIDVRRTLATDFCCNILDLKKYIKENSVALIYSSHTLEHFSRRQAILILNLFYDLLKPSGRF